MAQLCMEVLGSLALNKEDVERERERGDREERGKKREERDGERERRERELVSQVSSHEFQQIPPSSDLRILLSTVTRKGESFSALLAPTVIIYQG